jgi:hypothetical protein
MANERINDLIAFKCFIEEQLPSGGAGVSLDEALVLWGDENHTAIEHAASVEAVKEALDDMRAGDTGIPAREFLAGLRRRYNLPARR